jgi:hypothetical protein
VTHDAFKLKMHRDGYVKDSCRDGMRDRKEK